MARYKVLETSYINDAIIEPGTIVEYQGEPGANLELVKEDKSKGKTAPADEPLV